MFSLFFAAFWISAPWGSWKEEVGIDGYHKRKVFPVLLFHNFMARLFLLCLLGLARSAQFPLRLLRLTTSPVVSYLPSTSQVAYSGMRYVQVIIPTGRGVVLNTPLYRPAATWTYKGCLRQREDEWQRRCKWLIHDVCSTYTVSIHVLF